MLTIKTFFLTLIFTGLLYAGENFSEMSTQELIAIMGYVKKSDESKFKQELKTRIPSMTSDEKAKYEKNVLKLK